MHNFNRGKGSPQIWATSVNLKKLPNLPIGEKSSNLVTLTKSHLLDRLISVFIPN
jgi:hypothetical protein